MKDEQADIKGTKHKNKASELNSMEFSTGRIDELTSSLVKILGRMGVGEH